MTAAAAALPQRGPLAQKLGDYLALSKARIVMLIVITTAAGYWLAADRVDGLLLIQLLAGTALVAGGTNALNQVWERDLDGLMARTRKRPLPSGRLGTAESLVFSIAISVIGIVWLALAVNLLASALSLATLVSYLFIYTPLKTRTTLSTIIGAAPGAVPPMIGYAAATGVLDATAWTLFAFQFAWQLPHFLALSWIYRDDYARGGYRMTAVVDPTGAAVARQAFAWSVALLGITVVPFILGVAGTVYLVAALLAGAALLYAAVSFARTLTMKAARTLFMGSNLYLVVVMAFLVIG